MDVADTLRQLIIEELDWDGPPELLTGDYDLLENDVIDSMKLMQLIEMVDETLGVEIDDEELTPENCTTIDQLTALITSKMPS